MLLVRDQLRSRNTSRLYEGRLLPQPNPRENDTPAATAKQGTTPEQLAGQDAASARSCRLDGLVGPSYDLSSSSNSRRRHGLSSSIIAVVTAPVVVVVVAVSARGPGRSGTDGLHPACRAAVLLVTTASSLSNTRSRVHLANARLDRRRLRRLGHFQACAETARVREHVSTQSAAS